MTREDYLKLLSESPVFAKMADIYKEDIKAATGEMMERYANIFFSANKVLIDAKKNFLTRNEEILKGLETQIKVILKSKLKDDEKRTIEEEEKKMEGLLKQI